MAIDHERIQKSIGKLRKFANKIPKHPSPEEIHKLRTNSRKIQAAFGALSLDTGKNQQQLMKEIRKIHRRAGKVRDLDVLTGDLARVHADGESECEVQLLEYLGSEREKQVGKLHGFISKHRAELKSRLRQASKKVEKFLEKNEAHRASLAAAHALQLSSELNLPKRLNRGNLHPYRLKVKELRYVLQLAESEQAEFVKDLGNVKDSIGEWHDWEELLAIANEVLDHGPGCRLAQKLREISNSKYKEALHQAQNLRQRYLTEPTPKKPSRPVELKAPVVQAAAQLSRSQGSAA